MKHESVMLEEAVDGLAIRGEGVYVDGTFGAGGHSREILKRLTTGVLYGMDRDLRVLQAAQEDDHLRLRHNNFSDMADVLRADGVREVDGVLLDLGVSSMQFDEADRGFSYRFPAELDMRMNQQASLSAQDVLQQYSEEELWYMFSDYGEIRNAKSLAKCVVENRRRKKIQTTEDLIFIASQRSVGNKMRYLSQVFQAIRMEVNDEVGELKKFLKRLPEFVKPGGRVVIISFHSLEDRLVKNYFRHGNAEGAVKTDFYGETVKQFEMLTKKLVTASEEEILQNKRSRSAKMRIGVRMNNK